MKTMPWTRFMDMHSGGSLKEPPAAEIYVEAPMAEASVIFYNRFGHSPSRVTCTCCGDDYSISESETLEEASAYDRGCHYAYFYRDDGTEVSDPMRPVYDPSTGGRRVDGREVEGRYVERSRSGSQPLSLEEYASSERVLIIRGVDISPEQRIGEVPEQGYVWLD